MLVVDDEAGITESLCDLLGDEGFQVMVARNGKDALQRVNEHRPDLILLDYMMPVMDGRDTLKALQEHQAYHGIPVILMSAMPRRSLPEDCNPTAYLRKPFEVDALLSEVNRWLRGART